MTVRHVPKCLICGLIAEGGFLPCAFCREPICFQCSKTSPHSIVTLHYLPGSVRRYCAQCRDALCTDTPQMLGIDPQDPVLAKEYAAFKKEREVYTIAVTLSAHYNDWKDAQARYNNYVKAAEQDLADLEREGIIS